MWCCKREEELKEIQQSKELIIKKRISALYDKMDLIYDTCTDDNCKRQTYTNTFSINNWYQYRLNTTYGTRYLLIHQSKNILFYGKDFDFNSWVYYRNPNTDFIKIFEITCNDNVRIEPKPMVELTPQEIDLAILEFEEAIEEKYQIAKTRKSKHDECVEYFSNESEK